jgi:hypothetical protein
MLFLLTQAQAEGWPDVAVALIRLRLDICLATLLGPGDWRCDLALPTFATCAKQVPVARALSKRVPLPGVYRLLSQSKYNSFAYRITAR